MLVLLAFLAVSSVFIAIAMLVADVLLSRWVARQDVVWRVTLIGVCLIPAVLFLRPWLTTGVLSIPVSVNTAKFGFAAPLTANNVSLPTPSALETHSAPVIDASGVTTSSFVSPSAAPRSSVIPSPQVIAPPTESTTQATDWRFSSPASVASRAANGLNRMENGVFWFAVLWAAGTLFRLVTTCGGYWHLRQQTRAAVGDPDSRWQRIADELSYRDSLSTVQVRFCSSSSTPTIGGFLRGVVLIPRSMRMINDDTMIRQILIHERTHLLRCDQWTNLLLHVAGTALWLHPLYYWMKRRILWLREVICDASVVQEFSAVQYAETLLELSKRNTGIQRNAMAVAMAVPRSLLGKIVTFLLSLTSVESLMRPPVVTRRIGWLITGITCTMLGLVQFNSAAQESANPVTANGEEPIASEQTTRENATRETTHSLSGRVSLPDGLRAANATVYLLAEEIEVRKLPTHPATTQTDDSGKYTFENVEPGNYRVWAELSNMTSLETFLGGKTLEIQGPKDAEPASDLQMHEGCCYAVRVIDKGTRKGIAKAEIKFGWPDIDRNYFTDVDGFVEVGGLAKNDWYFVVQAADYAVNYRKISAQPLGSRMELTFEMAAGATIIGTVSDENRTPLVGASIRASAAEGVMTPSLGQVVTDANGKYELKSMPIGEEIELRLQLGGFTRTRKITEVQLGQQNLTLNLLMKRRPPNGDCILTVKDEKGNPIAGATITGDGGYSAEKRTFTTDEQGVAVMRDLPSTFHGTRGGIHARGLIPKVFDFALGSPTEPGEVSAILEKGKSIRGRLVSPEGKPAAGISVYFNDGERDSEYGGRVLTDNEGRFQVDGLPDPSTFTFYTLPEFAPIDRLVLPVGTDREIIVTMDPEAVVRVRAVDSETGEVIPEFNVRVKHSPDSRKSDPAFSFSAELSHSGADILGASREFRLGHLPHGAPLQVTVAAKGYEKTVVRRVEARIQSEPIDVKLVRRNPTQYTSVSGVLKDPTGNPVSGAMIKLVVGFSPPRSAKTQQPINFRIGQTDVTRWEFYDWKSVESGSVRNDPQCLQFLSTRSNDDGTFSFDNVRKAAWMEIFFTGKGIANGRHEIDRPMKTSPIENLVIFTCLPGSVRVTVDRDAFPGAAYIELKPEWNDLKNPALDSANQPVPNGIGKVEVLVSNLPPGRYKVALLGPFESKSNGSSYFQRLLATTSIEVREGAESLSDPEHGPLVKKEVAGEH